MRTRGGLLSLLCSLHSGGLGEAEQFYKEVRSIYAGKKETRLALLQMVELAIRESLLAYVLTASQITE